MAGSPRNKRGGLYFPSTNYLMTSAGTNMKSIFIVVITVIFLNQHVLMYPTNTPIPCLARVCAEENKPVCGMQKVGVCWEEKIFNSSCLMDSANDCGQAHYILCTQNVCKI